MNLSLSTSLKQLGLILTLATVFVACNDDDPAPATPEVQLQPLLYEEPDYKKEFVYDNSNRLVQIKMTSTFANGYETTSVQNLVYDANGKLAELTSDTGFRFVYTYAGNRIATTQEWVNGTASRMHRFTYDDRGRVTEAIVYQNIPDEGGEIPTSSDRYEYDANGNLAVWTMYYYTTFGREAKVQTVLTFSDYDNKVNTEDLFEPNVFNPGMVLRKNNPGKLVVTNGNSAVTSTERYTYEYHEQGFATSKTTEVTLHHGGTGSYRSAYTFRPL